MTSSSAAPDAVPATSDRPGRATATSRSVIASASTHRWMTPILLGLLASAVSFIGSWHVSMWVDEGYTLSVATRSLSDIWRMVHTIDVVHALNASMMHFWLELFGTSAVSLRLPSAIAVGLAAAGVTVLTRALHSERAAIAAGLVFAVLPRVTSVGMEGRSYAATIAVATWLTVLFVSVHRKPAFYKYVIYAVGTAFAISLNIFLLLLVAAHGITALIDARFRWRRLSIRWVVAAALGILGGLPVLITATTQSSQIGSSPVTLAALLRNAVVNQWFLGETPTIFLSGGGVAQASGPALWKPAAVGLALVCLSLVALAVFRRDPAGSAVEAPGYRAVLVPWLIAPTVVLITYAIVATPLYNPRYLSFCTAPVAALVGIGWVRLPRPSMRWISAGLIVVLVAPIYYSQRTVYAKGGADWSLVAAFVQDHRGGNDGVYFAPRLVTTNPKAFTSRNVAVMYPAAFRGIEDVASVETPAQAGDLVGRSMPLSEAKAKLSSLDRVFVIWRSDYPQAAMAADTLVLQNAGFHSEASWTGPINRVEVFVR